MFVKSHWIFYLFQAFVEMSNSEDAEMLVKYYTIHPLTISHRTIRMNICTKYKTLTWVTYLCQVAVSVTNELRNQTWKLNVCFRVRPGKGEQVKEELEECGEKNSSSSRTSSKSSSKPQRSSSSRAKESSSKKAQESKVKEEEEEVRAEAGSGDEGQGVVGAHDEEEEAPGEDLVTEESVTTQPDQEAAMEFEESAMEPEEEGKNMHDEEDTEIPEEEALEQKHQTEQPVEHEEDQEQEDSTELKETDEQDDVQEEGTADDSIEQVNDKLNCILLRSKTLFWL